MSASGVTLNTNLSQKSMRTKFQQLKKDCTDLGQSLNSGDLAVTQKPFVVPTQNMAQDTTAATVKYIRTNSQVVLSNIDIMV